MRSPLRTVSLLALAAVVVAPATAQNVRASLLFTVDVSSTANASNPEFIGSNPSAMAWDGTDLYVAGINQSGANGPVAIVRIANAATNPTFGTSFGQVQANNLRGYTGLDVDGQGRVVASCDSVGASIPEGISAWDGPNGTNLWLKAARGGSGAAHDPGFGGSGNGTAWTTFGSGRRALQDTGTGADVFTTANGMIIVPSGFGTFWRDMDFDDVTGDFYARNGNAVVAATRTGANSVSNVRILALSTRADFTALQTCAFIDQGDGREVVIYNDRVNANLGQNFTDVVRVVRPDGTVGTVDFGAFTAPTGSGAYDFSYDAASNTLAISDFNDRAVHVFSVDVDPYYPYGDPCLGTGGIAPRLDVSATPVLGGTFDFVITDGVGGGAATLLFGLPGRFDLRNGCELGLNPIVLLLDGFTLGGSMGTAGAGTLRLPVTIPSTLSGFDVAVQAHVIDGAVGPLPVVPTNALFVTVR